MLVFLSRKPGNEARPKFRFTKQTLGKRRTQIEATHVEEGGE